MSRAARTSGLTRAIRSDAGSPCDEIHPHVEGTGILVAEAAGGILDLHRGDAEIHEDDVRCRDPLLGEHSRQVREVAVARHEAVGTETRSAQACFRSRQLDRVDVQTNQAAAGAHGLQDRLRVSPATERAVNRDVAGRRSKAVEDLLEHDGPMRAGWRCENHGYLQPGLKYDAAEPLPKRIAARR